MENDWKLKVAIEQSFSPQKEAKMCLDFEEKYRLENAKFQTEILRRISSSGGSSAVRDSEQSPIRGTDPDINLNANKLIDDDVEQRIRERNFRKITD